MSWEIDEVTEFVDGGRKQLKVSPRANPVQVYGGTWKLVLDHGWEQVTKLLTQGALSLRDYGLFMTMVKHMGAGNRCHLSQVQLATETGAVASSVSRSMKALKALGLVRDNMVSPLFVTAGRTEDYPATLAAWNKLGGDATRPREFGDAKGESA